MTNEQAIKRTFLSEGDDSDEEEEYKSSSEESQPVSITKKLGIKHTHSNRYFTLILQFYQKEGLTLLSKVPTPIFGIISDFASGDVARCKRGKNCTNPNAKEKILLHKNDSVWEADLQRIYTKTGEPQGYVCERIDCVKEGECIECDDCHRFAIPKKMNYFTDRYLCKWCTNQMYGDYGKQRTCSRCHSIKCEDCGDLPYRCFGCWKCACSDGCETTFWSYKSKHLSKPDDWEFKNMICRICKDKNKRNKFSIRICTECKNKNVTFDTCASNIRRYFSRHRECGIKEKKDNSEVFQEFQQEENDLSFEDYAMQLMGMYGW